MFSGRTIREVRVVVLRGCGGTLGGIRVLQGSRWGGYGFHRGHAKGDTV